MRAIRVMEQEQHPNHVQVACRVYKLRAVLMKHTQFDRETNGRDYSREWYMQMPIIASRAIRMTFLSQFSARHMIWIQRNAIYPLQIIAKKINTCELAPILIWNLREWFFPVGNITELINL